MVWPGFFAAKRCPRGEQQYGNGDDRLASYGSAFNYDSTFTYNTERHFQSNFNYFTHDIAEPTEPRQVVFLSTIIEFFFVVLSALVFFLTLPVSLFFSVKFVSSFERMIIMRLGKVRKVCGPGTVFILPCIDRATTVDVRASSLELPALQVITADKGLAEVNAVVFSQIFDPMAAICGIQNREQTVKSLAYNIIYNNLVKRMLSDLTNPTTLAKLLFNCQEQFNDFCKNLGIESTKITVTQVKVIKQGENQAVSLFNTLLKSDMGSQLMNQFAPHVASFLAENNGGSVVKNEQRLEMQKCMNVVQDADLQRIIDRINGCCDAALVARVRKYYRIRCTDNNLAEFDIDLRENPHGWCGWTTEERSRLMKVDVLFSLKKEAIFSLINGEVTPTDAYINGHVAIDGSLMDAVPLKYLAEKAKDMK